MATNQQAQNTNILQTQHHQNNGWTTRGEKLVRYWQEECRLYAWMYEQNATYYSRLNRTLGIASIALSAITGTTLFNQSASDPDATSSNILIGLGISSIASTILSGLKELLDLNSLITQNTNAARENSSIVMDIDEQMNIERADRTDGREFMKSIKDRKNALIQNGPIIPSRQWKQVHRKIQSKEQLGFLNREVFNEYLEQSVDINKLHFGSGTIGNTNTLSTSAMDYGTPSSNSGAIDTSLEQQRQQQHPDAVVINMPIEQQQTLHKRATLPEKLAFYGGPRQHVIPIIPYNPTPADLEAIGKEIENLQPRTAARKALLENQYELERLLSKAGELKNKDRQQIATLRDKARAFRENYNKLINPQIADYNSIINSDCYRAAQIIRAYRVGHLTEPELFRIIQMDLMEIDRETFQDETRIANLICKTRIRLDKLQLEKATQLEAHTFLPSKYPFKDQEPNKHEITTHIFILGQKRDAICSEITQINSELERIQKELVNCLDEHKSELSIRLRELQELQQNLQIDYETITAEMANIEQTNDIGYARPECQPHQLAMTTMTNSSSTQSVFSPSVQRTLPQTQQQQQQSTQLTDIQSQINKRPPSTVPSDDEFIENMISDNLCAKQLRDVIKPIAIPSSPPSSPGQDISSNSTSNTKSPKRRSSKYDAQMRYQTSRIN
jgi:hypothetical protein